MVQDTSSFAGHSPPPLAPVAAPVVEPARFRILVTDDDKGSREAIAQLLAARGFEIVQANSGEQAIDIVRVKVIHLVVFDMHMPRMTGLEALEQIRLINSILPALLMTADATRSVIQQALQAQVYSVLPKPVNTTLLFHAMTRALSQVYGKMPGQHPQTQQPPVPPATAPE